MELSNDLLGLEVTNSDLFNITVNMTYGDTTLLSHYSHMEQLPVTTP